MMHAFVDKETCIGCGLCPSICPAVFEMDDDGKAVAHNNPVPAENEDDARAADSSCPVNAISLD